MAVRIVRHREDLREHRYLTAALSRQITAAIVVLPMIIHGLRDRIRHLQFADHIIAHLHISLEHTVLLIRQVPSLDQFVRNADHSDLVQKTCLICRRCHLLRKFQPLCNLFCIFCHLSAVLLLARNLRSQRTAHGIHHTHGHSLKLFLFLMYALLQLFLSSALLHPVALDRIHQHICYKHKTDIQVGEAQSHIFPVNALR